MAKTRQHLTPAEAAERGLLCKKDLKALGLMPGPATRPAGTVWQGRGAYYVYAPAECGPYVRQPNQALLRRREAASVAAEWLAGETVILDTETTGLYDAEIVELSIIDTAGNVLLDTLVRPTRPIPAEATEIHGITDEMVANAPTWAEVYPQYQALVAGKTIAAYNAEFDAGMVDKLSGARDRATQHESASPSRQLELRYAPLFALGWRNAGRRAVPLAQADSGGCSVWGAGNRRAPRPGRRSHDIGRPPVPQ